MKETESFKAVKVSEHVYWVGAIDWTGRDFHGYLTQRGTTYNAYLVMADKVTLIDTVKAPFAGEMLGRIASVVDPASVRYIISNHSELDHTGCLPQAIAALAPEKVFASPNGVRALNAHFDLPGEITPVKDGEAVDLGNMQLTCLETKMLHWPDSMISYLAADELLFSQDGFGMHLATSERFADEVDESILEYEAGKYYANILLPLSGYVTKLLERVAKLNLPIKTIAPDHGPIWRRNLNWILDRYARYARQEPANKAVVVYDTMWGSTDLMARAIADGLAAGGTRVRLMKMRSDDRSSVVAELLDAGAVLVGSPTINNGMFPTMADLLCYLRGLKPMNKIGAAFGSFGWSGEAVGQVRAELEAAGVEMIDEAPGVRAKFVPDATALADCRELGRKISERLAGTQA